MEKWKDVIGFEGLYQVSDMGRVRSVDRIIVRSNGTLLPLKGRILPQYQKLGNSTMPRLYVNLCKHGKAYTKLVHRLVAEAFIPNPEKYEQVNHKDENPLNNNLGNLEWCTNIYNHNYGTRNERQAKSLHKSVEMYDINGKYVRTFESVKAAALEINGDPSSITKVCKGKYKHHKNFIFKYASQSAAKLEEF